MSLNVWQEVVRAAIIGSARQSLTLPPAGTPLGDLLDRLKTAERESALLGVAASVALYQRAAALPMTDQQPLPEPCELDDLPRCSARAGQRLTLMLNGVQKDVLPEWLTALAVAGRRVSEEQLPSLLERGRAQADLRAPIKPVLGKRGQWLARQNPDWDYVGGECDESVWQTGSRAARLALLQSLRGSDPARGRELVASTWAAEPPDERAAFITAFRQGLSEADEPFLEAALDDRRKEVRRAAAELLALLPNSRLCQRMIERARPLLSITKTLSLTKGRKPRIEVTLPAACDKAMVRDGIEPKPGGSTKGEKAWWLEQMLGAIPPMFWCRALGQPPRELIAAASRGEWRAVLLEGWAAVAERQREAEWIEALLEDLLRQSEAVNKPRLFRALPAERQEAFILNLLRARPSLQSDQPAHWFLSAYLHPWSETLSEAVLKSLADHIARKDFNFTWKWSAFLEVSGVYFHPALTTEALSHLSQAATAGEEWSSAFERFLTRLQFRHEMLNETTDEHR